MIQFERERSQTCEMSLNVGVEIRVTIEFGNMKLTNDPDKSTVSTLLGKEPILQWLKLAS